MSDEGTYESPWVMDDGWFGDPSCGAQTVYHTRKPLFATPSFVPNVDGQTDIDGSEAEPVVGYSKAGFNLRSPHVTKSPPPSVLTHSVNRPDSIQNSPEQTNFVTLPPWHGDLAEYKVVDIAALDNDIVNRTLRRAYWAISRLGHDHRTDRRELSALVSKANVELSNEWDRQKTDGTLRPGAKKIVFKLLDESENDDHLYNARGT